MDHTEKELEKVTQEAMNWHITCVSLCWREEDLPALGAHDQDFGLWLAAQCLPGSMVQIHLSLFEQAVNHWAASPYHSQPAWSN